MFAEYEKAQLMERYRRGKAHRARTGSVNVLSGAPFGYRYLRKSDHAGAAYEIIEHEAALVAEMFRRYADDGASIADLARWLTGQGAPTRTGKHRWDRSVVWAMLRNPAYAGTAVFGKTMATSGTPGLNRVARLQGRATPRAVKTVDRPREQWLQIPIPANVSEETFARVAQRLEDNKRFAARNTKVPSLLQGLAACSACGYGYYRTSARTTSRKIYYYRCLGSDDYRYEGGRVCGNQPVRADYLDTVVWDHITALLADPALIRAEISKRLEQARTSDPVTRQRNRLELEAAKTTTSIAAMIEAFSEQLLTIDDLRAGMPHCAHARRTCKASSAPSTPRPPTATPTSSSPTTWKASSPSCAATPPRPPSKTARRCCGCSSRTSSSAPRKSPSGTASPPGQAAPAPASATRNPIRRVTIAQVIHCVGGVMGTVWWASGEGPLAAYAAGYRCELERRGFSPRAVRDRMEVAGQLDRWLAAEGHAVAGLTVARAGQFFAALRAAGQRRVPAMPTLAPLFAWPRDQQVLPPERAPATPAEELLASYRRYLAVERGVAPLTVLRYEWMARRFLAGRLPRAVRGGGSVRC
jgi:hypothetical protein